MPGLAQPTRPGRCFRSIWPRCPAITRYQPHVPLDARESSRSVTSIVISRRQSAFTSVTAWCSSMPARAWPTGSGRAAAEIFDQLDARPWAERARAELRASGETLAVGGDGGEQLTAQELQIALLVTEGQTNAEVGRALFLSTRTVEFHLSRAYRKLGVSSRTELTRRFARAGTG